MKKLIKITLKIIIIFLLCALFTTSIGCKNIDKLIQNLNSDDSKVRINAESALIKIGEPAVEPLIRVLIDKKNLSRLSKAYTAIILGQIGDSRAIEPLINVMTEVDNQGGNSVVYETVYALNIMCKDKNNEKLIAEKLIELDYEFLKFTRYQYLIQIGASGTEEFLISFLNKYGGSSAAVDFVESGNDKLEKAGSEWAKRNGWTIIRFPSSGGKNGAVASKIN